MCDLTVIILTFNEEKNIERAISSVKNIAQRIVVVDSGSTDKTVEISKELGADVYFHEWTNYSTQFNQGLENTNIDTKWVLRLDADEYVSSELSDEINSVLPSHDDSETNGFELRTRIMFFGRWIKHGGTYPLIIPRIFKYGYGHIEARNMDEHTIIDGPVIRLRNDLIHYDFKGLYEWIDKYNKYSAREALDYFDRNNVSDDQIKKKFFGSQRKRKRFLKNGVYYSIPKFWRAWFYYIYRYYFCLGFLDGKEGKIFCFLQAYWYRFLVDAKIFEKEREDIK